MLFLNSSAQKVDFGDSVLNEDYMKLDHHCNLAKWIQMLQVILEIEFREDC